MGNCEGLKKSLKLHYMCIVKGRNWQFLPKGLASSHILHCVVHTVQWLVQQLNMKPRTGIINQRLSINFNKRLAAMLASWYCWKRLSQVAVQETLIIKKPIFNIKRFSSRLFQKCHVYLAICSLHLSLVSFVIKDFYLLLNICDAPHDIQVDVKEEISTSMKQHSSDQLHPPAWTQAWLYNVHLSQIY